MKESTEQSSRIYYKNKDHKDIYGQFEGSGQSKMEKPMFHGALFMNDDEPNNGILWRKMFRDRYFKYYTSGSYEWNAINGICYINPAVNTIGLGDYMYRGSTQHYDVCAINPDSNPFYLSSEDGKCLKAYNRSHSLFSQNLTTYHSTKDYIIGQAYGTSRNHYKMNIKKSDNPGMPYEFESLEKVFGASDFDANPNSTFSPVSAGNESNLLLVQGYDNNSKEFIGFYNADTNAISKYVIPTGTLLYSLTNLVSANGRVFLIGSVYNNKTLKYDTGYRELTGGTFGELKYFPMTFNSNISRKALRYHNGTYYLYLMVYSTPYLYTTTDFSTFTRVPLPESITIREINGRRNPLTISLISDTPRMINFDMLNYNSAFQIYEDNKKVFGTPDMAFLQYYGSGWSNYAIVYLDNLTFQESDNNFYFLSSDCGYNSYKCFDNQGMWKHYYNLESEA